jgi:hypothetical protein
MNTQAGEIIQDFSPSAVVADEPLSAHSHSHGGTHTSFSPKGAFAFFAVMMAMYALMWFSLYFELISRR